jgi:AcrR family transcriptional regulator
MKEPKLMKIGELERLSGVPRHTIHYYLREGLLHSPQKTGKTMAYYDHSHLDRLKQITETKGDTRLPLSYLRKTLEGQDAARGRRGGAASYPPAGEDREINPRERRRQEIKEAAIILYARKGFHRTTISDITRAAGISTGTFYLYFKDKRDLLIETLDDLVRSIVEGNEAIVMQDSDLLRRSIQRARLFSEIYSRYSEIIHQLRAEMTSEESWAREKAIEVQRKMAEPIINEVRAAVEGGLIREVDPELLAFLVMGMVESLALRLTLDDKYTFDQAARFIMDIAVNGVVKDPERLGAGINQPA